MGRKSTGTKILGNYPSSFKGTANQGKGLIDDNLCLALLI